MADGGHTISASMGEQNEYLKMGRRENCSGRKKKRVSF